MATKKKVDAHMETALATYARAVTDASTSTLHTMYGRLRYASAFAAAAMDSLKKELFDRIIDEARARFVPESDGDTFDPDVATLEWANEELGGSVARQVRSGSLQSMNHGLLLRRLEEHGIPPEKAGTRRFVFDERRVIAFLESQGLAIEEFGVWDFESDPKKIEKLVAAEMLPVEVIEETCTFKTPTFALLVSDNGTVLEEIEEGHLIAKMAPPLLLPD